MTPDLWNDCMLDGERLDLEVVSLLRMGRRENQYGRCIPVSTEWHHGGPLIESNQIFLEPPTRVHINYGYDHEKGGCRGEWIDYPFWRATVSAKVRTYPNPRDPGLPGLVGRGAGPTPLIAAMRAIVASFGPGVTNAD